MSQTAINTTHTTTSADAQADAQSCEPTQRVTKSPLGYGILAGPLDVVVLLAQGLHQRGVLPHPARGQPAEHRRPRLDIEITNFLLCGSTAVAGAVAVRRALACGRGATWGPRLVAMYGVSLISAGIVRADPSMGVPVGAGRHGSGGYRGALHGVAVVIASTRAVAIG